MTAVFHITNDRTRNYICGLVVAAPEGHLVSISPPKRSLMQNRLMWKLLEQIAQQVVWHGQKLTKENWKDIFTASLNRQTVVPGLDGGFVVCGNSTSKMTIPEMSELCELALAFGAQQGVMFEDDAA